MTSFILELFYENGDFTIFSQLILAFFACYGVVLFRD
ncbi:hypothetical protein AM412_001950 [Acinetobacter baumannii]|nr:hypothetical protein A388_01926 [Acinetobacter baumannii]OKO30736.1 hypothetical protein AM412_001950 [Acinetobacter baumannii]OKO38663.1 hypothetical protein AM416_001969 [Acinetobacter baumannii]SLM56307.1 Uncharacterised protein [Acinetobacter baumannii]SMB69715.1 Uncharacterised protein [Acinetobacter baumannii]